MRESWPEAVSDLQVLINERLQKINEVYGLTEKSPNCSLTIDLGKSPPVVTLRIPLGKTISNELAYRIKGSPKTIANRVLPILNEVLAKISTP